MIDFDNGAVGNHGFREEYEVSACHSSHELTLFDVDVNSTVTFVEYESDRTSLGHPTTDGWYSEGIEERCLDDRSYTLHGARILLSLHT